MTSNSQEDTGRSQRAALFYIYLHILFREKP